MALSAPPASLNERALGLGEGERLACRLVPTGDMTVELLTCFEAEEEATRLIKKIKIIKETLPPLGLAVDVGSTTVEATLVDLDTGRELASRSALNPQTRWGMDVLSRISHVMTRSESLREMREALTATLGVMAEALCQEVGVRVSAIEQVVAAGNCVMLHILMGVSPASLGAFPFTPVFTEALDVSAAEVGLRESARLYCPPSASAFIGADVVAGICASDLMRRRGNTLFIDIGTNGEMALSHGGRLTSCSCAAGPALEGMNISCGTRATPGAVDDVVIGVDGRIQLKVIGRQNPLVGYPSFPFLGLCGSGVLAAIREFLRVGLLRPDGAFAGRDGLPPGGKALAALYAEDGLSVRLGAGLAVTQKDVRQVQLAKGALLSGVCALLECAGLDADGLDAVLVAGQFGARLSAQLLTDCGVLPPGLEKKIEYLGNASKAGARLALTSHARRREMEALARKIEYLDLSSLPNYENLFLRCLSFTRGGTP
jgi:uncharacterized 2Fe-2S/4Fe-4S cluster protein (DUF4445 family)